VLDLTDRRTRRSDGSLAVLPVGGPWAACSRDRRVIGMLELLLLLGTSVLGLAIVLALTADCLDGPGPGPGE
jgi:hypothetical protein